MSTDAKRELSGERVTALFGERCPDRYAPASVDPSDECGTCVVWELYDRLEAAEAENAELRAKVAELEAWKAKAIETRKALLVLQENEVPHE